MEEYCRKCGKTLFRKVHLDEKGHVAIDSRDRDKVNLDKDDTDYFYRCPHCSAKNVVMSFTGNDDLGALRISHIKED